MPPQQLGAMLESRLCLGGDSSAAEQDERAAEAAEEPTPMQQLLKLCGQEVSAWSVHSRPSNKRNVVQCGSAFVCPLRASTLLFVCRARPWHPQR